jgi:hypothetical protein
LNSVSGVALQQTTSSSTFDAGDNDAFDGDDGPDVAPLPGGFGGDVLMTSATKKVSDDASVTSSTNDDESSLALLDPKQLARFVTDRLFSADFFAKKFFGKLLSKVVENGNFPLKSFY